MTDPAAERAKQLFNDALELPRAERPAYLEAACGSDAALRGRVERLLGSFERAGGFLDSPTATSAGALPPPAGARLEPGATLGARYRIVAFAGRGGMGEVYRAEDLELGQTVALKLLPAALGRDEEQLARLREEVRIARRVSHPNVCRVYDIGEAEGRRFLSMEWIEGRDLASILRDDGRLPTDRATFWARQIAAGLAAAHERGVLHRDLKPSNVMIDERGVARIADFGLASATGAVRGDRAREGTPRYMAPEQLAGERATLHSDLYALGLVLYELYTGERGRPGDSLEELARRRREPPAPPSRLAPDIEPEVERLILHCLEADPARRPASARTVLEALPGGEPFADAAAAAQRRADRIAAFRAELDELRGAGLLRLGEQELRAVAGHHERVLRDLVQRFDVDVSERGKQLSLGMRAVSFVGAAALAASVYYFFFRIWGTIPTAAQVGILAGSTLATLGLTAIVSRRDRSGYFTLMSALVAFTCFVVNTSMLGVTFNLAPSAWPVLAWGGLALVLAYACRLRLLLVVGLVVLAAFVGSALLHFAGGFWGWYLERPEGFFPSGLVLLALGLALHRRRLAAFRPVYFVLGVLFFVGPTALLGSAGWLSYLAPPARPIEIAYQVLGFAASAAAIWLGIARRRKEAVYSGTFFFVTLLFLEFVDWWWAWMPKYLFFLIVAATSVAVVIALKRLRATLAAPLEVGS